MNYTELESFVVEVVYMYQRKGLTNPIVQVELHATDYYSILSDATTYGSKLEDKGYGCIVKFLNGLEVYLTRKER